MADSKDTPAERPALKAAKAPAAETPPAPETLLLKAPVNGLVAGRVVTASAATAKKLIEAEQAAKATRKQIAMAGTRIPHINA